VAELRFLPGSRGLVEPATPAGRPAPESDVVRPTSGAVGRDRGARLFDRRYRDLRGEDDPYGSQDPA
jgi:hypothetical protein